MKDELQTVA